VEINFLKRREEKLEGQNQGYFKWN
jgi:hypothetical protein